MKAHFDEHKDEAQFPEIWEEVHKHNLLRLTDTTDLTPAQIHNLIMKQCKMWETTQNILIAGVRLRISLFKLADEKKYDTERFIDYLTTVAKQWGEGANVPLPNLSATVATGKEYLLCGDREGTRDRNRRILPLIMTGKYEAVGIPIGQKANFSWTHTLDIMWKHQMRVVDWPAKVVPLGPGFSTNGKGVTSEMLDAICLPLLKARMDNDDYRREELRLVKKTATKGKGKGKGKGKEKEKAAVVNIPIPDREFEIVPWLAEHKMWADKQDLKMLDIPLVIDTDGTVLQYLRDSAAFQSTLPKDFNMPNSIPIFISFPHSRSDISREQSIVRHRRRDSSSLSPAQRQRDHTIEVDMLLAHLQKGMPMNLWSMSLVAAIATEPPTPCWFMTPPARLRPHLLIFDPTRSTCISFTLPSTTRLEFSDLTRSSLTHPLAFDPRSSLAPPARLWPHPLVYDLPRSSLTHPLVFDPTRLSLAPPTCFWPHPPVSDLPRSSLTCSSLTPSPGELADDVHGPMKTPPQSKLANAAVVPYSEANFGSSDLAVSFSSILTDTLDTHDSVLSSASHTLQGPTQLKIATGGEAKERPHLFSRGLSMADYVVSSKRVKNQEERSNQAPMLFHPMSGPLPTIVTCLALVINHFLPEQTMYPSLESAGPVTSDLPTDYTGVQRNFPPQGMPGTPQHFIQGRPTDVVPPASYRQRGCPLQPLLPSPTGLGYAAGHVPHLSLGTAQTTLSAPPTNIQVSQILYLATQTGYSCPELGSPAPQTGQALARTSNRSPACWMGHSHPKWVIRTSKGPRTPQTGHPHLKQASRHLKQATRTANGSPAPQLGHAHPK
ncbi:hypothetical protein BU15DRAFT_75957 [Melanogaster broomeanus]|nr:hypothetical protein BU15DRAFT_75957 [Melanogaster broomeanus]